MIRLVAISAALLAMAACSKKDQPAAGPWQSDHLGVSATFPDGWMHRVKNDITRGSGANRERGSDLYLGELDDPDVLLSLRMTDPTPGAPPFADMSSELMLRSTRGGADAMARASGAVIEDCEVITLGGRMTGRCTGTVEKAERDVRIYAYVVGEHLGSALFLHRQSIDPAALDAIVASVRGIE